MRFVATRGLCGLAGVTSAVLVLAACGGVTRNDAAPVVQVSERDFGIVASPHVVSAGAVVLRIFNRGPDRHELIMVRAPVAHLPLRKDGMTINEETLKQTTVGLLEPGPAGSVRELRVRLKPGHYVLFCNMSGHYLGGMHTTLVVR